MIAQKNTAINIKFHLQIMYIRFDRYFIYFAKLWEILYATNKFMPTAMIRIKTIFLNSSGLSLLFSLLPRLLLIITTGAIAKTIRFDSMVRMPSFIYVNILIRLLIANSKMRVATKHLLSNFLPMKYVDQTIPPA
jgi:hypothetical protein